MYLAAVPVDGTSWMADSSRELAEIRWVSLAAAGEFMGDMAEGVQEHLRLVLRG